MKKIIRITTVPISLKILLKGQLEFMSQYFNMIAISSDEKEMNEIGKDQNIKTFSVEMTRKISPLVDIRSVINLYRILRKEKPDIVHTHTPKAGIVGMMASFLARVPHRLHTVAGLPLMEAVGTKRKVLNIVERLTYRLATRVYPNSLGLYNFILENKFAQSQKLRIIGNGSSNGIDTDFFNRENIQSANIKKIQSDLAISENDFVFVFVGRLVGDKGVNELIDAYTSIRKNNTKLLLVGSYEEELDPLKKTTLRKIAESKDIISAGFQKDVRPYFAISDALIFPSYREGFPNVVMQAGAMGLPSIVSDINGCNEIIIHGENGYIVPVKNSKELGNKMMELYENKNSFEYLKSKARKMITDRYEQKIIWEKLLEEYNSLLNIK